MSLFVDFLATASLVGIWPRFIEPRRVKVTHLVWELNHNQRHLNGFTLIHLTDLHFRQKMPQTFLNRILRKVKQEKPDLILFTGDFLCYSRLESEERFTSFLCNLEAPMGAFCTFGNHDYAAYVTLNRSGMYDVLPPPNPLAGIFKGMKTLLTQPKTGKGVSSKVLNIPLHASLCRVLTATPFKPLENATVSLPIGLNLTGLGDLALGRCRPEIAFAGYEPSLPGIVLSHNPDTVPSLLSYPGEWILSGHTHGEQIHLPWPKWGRKISQKLARLENSAYTRGLFTIGNKKLYVNRGLGCHKPFRLFSPPEICVIKAEYK